ncbi:hypothetical protein ACJX0J_006805, partial [Zea mays]
DVRSDRSNLGTRGQHISRIQGWRNVPPDVADYFRHDIDIVHGKRKARVVEEAQKLQLAGSHRGSDDDDEELRRHACASGGTYETIGGSSQGGVRATFGRTPSRKEKPHMVQTRIDIGLFSKAGKNVVHFVGHKHKSNTPYFINAFKGTQKHGECGSIVYHCQSMTYISHSY